MDRNAKSLSALALLIPLLVIRSARGEPHGAPVPPWGEDLPMASGSASASAVPPAVPPPQASSAASSSQAAPAPPPGSSSAAVPPVESPPAPAEREARGAEARGTGTGTGEQEQDEDPRRKGGGFARTIALGGGAILNARDENPFLQDVTYVLTNPAYAGLYPNYAWANLGRPRDGGLGAQGSTRVGNLSELTFVGGHFALTPRFTLGFLAGVKDSILFDQRPSADLEALNTALPKGTFVNPLLQTRLGSDGTNLTEDRTITNTYSVLAAWRASPTALLGLQLYSGHLASTIRQETEDPVSASSQRETRKAITGGFNLGAVLGQVRRVEVAARVRINSASRSDERSAGGQSSKVTERASAAPEVSLHGRAFLPVNRRLSVVPTLRAAYFGWSTDLESTPAQDPKPGTSKYLALDLEGGIGVNLRLSRALLVGGVAASYLRDSMSFRETGTDQSTERDQSVWVLDTPKLHLGAEVQATRWLALRLGYFRRSSTVSFSEETRATVGGKVSKFSRTARDYGIPFGRLSTGNLLSFGLGVAILDFYIDATVNLLDEVDQNRMLNQLSAHYIF